MKKLFVLLLALAMIFALNACADKGETPAAEPSPDASVENNENAEPAVDPSSLTIGTYLGATDQFFIMQEAGVKAACDEYGVNFVSAVTTGDAAYEQNTVNTYLTQGVDGMVLQVMESNAEVYRTANQEGMKIGTLTAFPDNDFTAAGYGYSQYALGEATADYAIEYVREKLDGKAKIHLERVWEGGSTDDRGNAFTDALIAEFGEENIEIVSTGNAIEVQVAMQQVRDALTANPEIDIVFCESEVDLDGAISAIEQLGMQDSVVCFAVDVSEPMCVRLLDEDDNLLQGCGGQDIYVNAYNTTVDLIKVLLGEKEYVPGTYEEVPALDLNKGNLEAVQDYLDRLREVTGS